jgi:methylated-DNA-protein-cysteine methyltransferase related protein
MSGSPFTVQVIKTLKRVPKGKVVTYGLLAAMAGSPTGARQVVRVLNIYSTKEKLPWYRVINSKGGISLPRGGGFELQAALLKREGVKVSKAGEIDLDKYLWRPRARRGDNRQDPEAGL